MSVKLCPGRLHQNLAVIHGMVIEHRVSPQLTTLKLAWFIQCLELSRLALCWLRQSQASLCPSPGD